MFLHKTFRQFRTRLPILHDALLTITLFLRTVAEGFPKLCTGNPLHQTQRVGLAAQPETDTYDQGTSQRGVRSDQLSEWLYSP